MPERLAVLVRIEARRPAAWLALIVAGLTAWWLPADNSTALAGGAVAVAIGVVTVVMALGDASPLLVVTDADPLWFATRAAWPLLGWVAAAAGRGDAVILAGGVVGILAGASIVAVLVRSSVLAADAASTALVAAGLATAAGWWVDRVWPGRLRGVVVAIAVVAGLAIVAVAWSRLSRSPWAVRPRYAARGRLTAVAMAGAVAGMVGWLFLAPESARWDLAASLGWFTALAVPLATLGDGVSHGVVWRWSERAAGAGRRLPPGRRRDRLQAVLGNAAVLAWPPIVASAVAGTEGGRAAAAAGIVVALAAATLTLAAVTWLADAWGVRPDTQQALALFGPCAALSVLPAGMVSGGLGTVFFQFSP